MIIRIKYQIRYGQPARMRMLKIALIPQRAPSQPTVQKGNGKRIPVAASTTAMLNASQRLGARNSSHDMRIFPLLELYINLTKSLLYNLEAIPILVIAVCVISRRKWGEIVTCTFT